MPIGCIISGMEGFLVYDIISTLDGVQSCSNFNLLISVISKPFDKRRNSW
jgi:hypothetical protein